MNMQATKREAIILDIRFYCHYRSSFRTHSNGDMYFTQKTDRMKKSMSAAFFVYFLFSVPFLGIGTGYIACLPAWNVITSASKFSIHGGLGSPAVACGGCPTPKGMWSDSASLITDCRATLPMRWRFFSFSHPLNMCSNSVRYSNAAPMITIASAMYSSRSQKADEDQKENIPSMLRRIYRETSDSR